MNTPLQRVADEVRGISSADLLVWHGFKLRREGLSFRAKTDRQNIVITGQKWFDNKVGVRGAGASDLQMHLCGGIFRRLASFSPRIFDRWSGGWSSLRKSATEANRPGPRLRN